MSKFQGGLAAAWGVALCAATGPVHGALGDTELISTRIPGQTTAGAFGGTVSADGRYVVFESDAGEIVPNDTNQASDVFLWDRQTGVYERISLTPGLGGGTQPSISADGRFVAYRYSSYTIFVRDRQTGATETVSVDSNGQKTEDWTHTPTISADGRYVAFVSESALAANDTNRADDVYLHDRQTGVTELISVDSNEVVGNAESNPYFYERIGLSADGRYVAFSSGASNLSPNDTNNTSDVFVRDRQAGVTEIISGNPIGKALTGDGPVGISADGRYVTFYSGSAYLVGGDTNGVSDVFVRDRLTGATQRASVSSSGEQGNGYSGFPWINADGRYIVFNSDATNLVSNDTNGVGDVFVRDLQAGVTERASIKSNGTQGNGSTDFPFISADGRYVLFISDASNLVAGDLNDGRDLFLRDRQTSTLTLASKSRVPSEAADGIDSPDHAISPDGRYVVFASRAPNIALGDTNDHSDVFLRDDTTGTIERISVSSSGEEGNNDSAAPVVSADGRFVAFQSAASNLVPATPELSMNIFVRDRQTGLTERLTTHSSDRYFNSSRAPSISSNGRFVAFHSNSDTLVPNDTNISDDVYVVDRQAHSIQRVSVSSSGAQAKGASSYPVISADGRYVAFLSKAPNLVAGDTNKFSDVFVHDRQTHVTERVNLSSSGEQAHNHTRSFALSANARYVAFQTQSNNMVPNDSNGAADIFLRDRQTGLTRRVSVDSSGRQADGSSQFPSVSADGRFVAFESSASNLVSGDKNFVWDIFLHDTVTGRTKRVSTLASGLETHADSDRAKLSADGHFVLFRSKAPLVETDLNNGPDLYVRELAVPQ